MNTKQAIALWYGGLSVVGVFVVMAFRNSPSPTSLVIAAIILITLLAILTLRSGSNIEPAKVFRWVGVPAILILVLAVVVGVWFWHRAAHRDNATISVTEFMQQKQEVREKLSGEASILLAGNDTFLRASLYNGSAYAVHEVVVEFNIRPLDPAKAILDGSTASNMTKHEAWDWFYNKNLTPEEAHVALANLTIEKGYKAALWSAKFPSEAIPRDLLDSVPDGDPNITSIKVLSRYEELGFPRRYKLTGTVDSYSTAVLSTNLGFQVGKDVVPCHDIGKQLRKAENCWEWSVVDANWEVLR